MADVSPDSTEVISLGNVKAILGTFSAIVDTNTWPTGLNTVLSCHITNGAKDADVGATYSGGTITFAASASLANAKVLAIGV